MEQGGLENCEYKKQVSEKFIFSIQNLTDLELAILVTLTGAW